MFKNFSIARFSAFTFVLFFGISCASTTATDSLFVLPAPAVVGTEVTLETVALGSCAHQAQPQPLWKHITAYKPQLYVAMGDNVYASRPEDKPIRKAYKIQAEHPEFVEFRKNIPSIGIYDDHDFGQNDGGVDNPEKHQALEDFIAYFPYAKELVPANKQGAYHGISFGKAPNDIHFIVVDTRFFRSNLVLNPKPKTPLDKFTANNDPSSTVLGEDQWKWLEQELAKKSALTIFVSSIQVLPEQHGFEKWANFPHERTRLLNLLAKHAKNKKVFIASGDRHLGEISVTRHKGVEFIEITASSINRPASIKEEANKYRKGPMYPKENFGILKVDWKKQQLEMSLLDNQGKSLHSEKRKF